MATSSERGITDDERGTRDRGRFEEAELRGRNDPVAVRSIVRSGPHRGRLVFDPDETDPRGTDDRAGVRSIVRSGRHRGRLVFDPERRFTSELAATEDQAQTGEPNTARSQGRAPDFNTHRQAASVTPKPKETVEPLVRPADESECRPSGGMVTDSIGTGRNQRLRR